MISKISIAMMLLAGLALGCAPTTNRQGQNPANSKQVITPVGSAVTPTASQILTNTPTATVAISTATSEPTASPGLTRITPLPALNASLVATNTLPTATPLISATVTSGASSSAKAPIEDGLRVYQQNYCGLCHQLDVAGTAGAFGPTHNHMAATAEQRIHEAGYTGVAKTAAEYIRESILKPNLYLVKGYENSSYHMPAFTNLSEADLNALVNLLLQQK